MRATGAVRVSAALIVRNEEAFLDGCLVSIAGAVDEIVVVDTGSTDRTMEIARAHGATLIERVWRDDFAWARNEGLAAASGEWILYIDADERLSLPPGAHLLDNLGDPNVVVGRVGFRPTLNATPYREYRLFRNDPRLRFKGSMHETILPDYEALKASIGATEGESPAEITHLGYEGDQMHKHRRNLPLLRSAIAAEPRRVYYWHHLSSTLAGLGEDEEALAVAKAGMARVDRATATLTSDAVASMLAQTCAGLMHAAGEDPLPMVEQGLALYPGNRALELVKARILLDQGRTAVALPILEVLAAIDSASYADPVLAFDRRIFDVYAPDLRGVALLRLGRREAAAEAFARAAAAAPEDMSYRVKAAALRRSA
ncbi:MAG: glycosyltransferase [Devosia sp.]|nr:glycosyltransferase [Devosia sp.]